MSDIFSPFTERILMINKWTSQYEGLVAGFTTKNGGVSLEEFSTLNTGFHVKDNNHAVIRNRELIAKDVAFPTSSWVGCEQTHEVNILKIENHHKNRGALDYESALKGIDGIYTKESGILLTLCYADCVPLYFLAPQHKMIGIAHAGWKGTVGGIAENMVECFKKEGIAPSDITVVIGPSICGDCYVVDDKVLQYVQNKVEDEVEKPYNQISEGQYKLDLRLLNAQILRKANVRIIEVTSLCTSCHENLFFSHRRDKGKTGRLMSFIGWKEDSSS
ncbi:peptidoglycan editing factor PgeF [Peribacillus alkalitolerans]|uniref:peptidoglycan editing factor PgeF n=1 Tax=Peribacillus alkalitolerans TaxID=1550385 RepID=UPI0013D81090|nr:peptidoglycan editing factor PgeF [Peribacillus alkalitolerans]